MNARARAYSGAMSSSESQPQHFHGGVTPGDLYQLAVLLALADDL